MPTPKPPDWIPPKDRKRWLSIWRDARRYWSDKETESESFWVACEVIAPDMTLKKLGPKNIFVLQ
jgi:hypothetical protein